MTERWGSLTRGVALPIWQVGVNEDGATFFRSTTPGDGKDNPTDPLELTPLQMSRSVELTFSNVDSFELSAHMAEGYKTQLGGNFIFSGPSCIVPVCHVKK